MKTKTLCAAAVTASLLCTSYSFAQSVHWGYEGEEGPAHWGSLNESFAMCAMGKQQSPVDISSAVSTTQSPLTFDYKAGGYEMINNGHALQVNYAPGSTLTVGDHQYELKQFHFHSPSENTINGKQFPLEAHFVHQDADGNYAVVAVMYDNGEPREGLASVWQTQLPKTYEKQRYEKPIDANSLLPESLVSYQFTGSLTTPPCSENVQWIVLKEANYTNDEIIHAFGEVVHLPNNRPVQPLNDRTISQ